MPRRKFKIKFHIITLVIFALGLLYGCGDDSSDETSNPPIAEPPSTPTPTGTPDDPDPVPNPTPPQPPPAPAPVPAPPPAPAPVPPPTPVPVPPPTPDPVANCTANGATTEIGQANGHTHIGLNLPPSWIRNGAIGLYTPQDSTGHIHGYVLEIPDMEALIRNETVVVLTGSYNSEHVHAVTVRCRTTLFEGPDPEPVR